ncbi:MAG TPA: PHP domain-containing protein [Thermoanaerobaculia bacterium]|nr:PHP domain-containing protein [Thermoanaerobaculia bacterium]HUM29271.1 PHP domain-containing protein [Thermoanaerobaculia bacterium]HXK67771.1 PHP domain-containing protein [Thermoanaerobaculia bacterium]
MNFYVDLHCHTSASDGSLNLTELHRLAAAAGLFAIAITDHDTLDGWASWSGRMNSFSNPEILPGVELSTNDSRIPRSIHLIGLGIPLNGHVALTLDRLAQSRNARNRKIIHALSDLGVPIGSRDREWILSRPIAGRAHIAAALVRAGHVKNLDLAFERYLNTGKPAYVNRKRLGFAEAIQLIRKDGGVSVLCHPNFLGLSEDQLESFLAYAVGQGLDAVETRYSEYSEDFVKWVDSAARRHGLLPCGGSDFHGRLKPGILPGLGRGGLRIPQSYYVSILERISSIRSAIES